MEVTKALRSSREDHLSHPMYVPGHELQDRSRQPDVRQIRRKDRSPPGVPAITVPLPPSHRLDHEDHHNRQEQRDTMDSLDTVG